MRFSNVLIVTYGRSGSTLLQGILNSIDGYLIRGENFQFCRGLHTSYESLLRAKREYGKPSSSGDPTRPWYGAADFDAKRFLADAQRLVMRQLAPGQGMYRCVGFKEIRYLETDREPGHPITDRRLRDYLWFLVRLFRSPGIILLRREHEAVIRSGWWSRHDSDRLRARLEAFDATCSQFASNYRNAFIIDYAEVVGQSRRLQDLFDFLDEPYDPDSIAAVLSRLHSSRTSRDAEESDPYEEATPSDGEVSVYTRVEQPS